MLIDMLSFKVTSKTTLITFASLLQNLSTPTKYSYLANGVSFEGAHLYHSLSWISTAAQELPNSPLVNRPTKNKYFKSVT